MDIQTIVNLRENNENIANHLTGDLLSVIGQQVYENYTIDLESRREWESRYKDANNLALQVVDIKNTPWEKASNVKFPLLTISCIQFAARVYAQLISGTNMVKMRVIGPDPTGEKLARARRVETHMSYQVLEEDANWEEEMDRILMALPLVGTVFKKTFYDPLDDMLVSQMVLPKDLVVNYFAKSIETAYCATHIIPMRENDIIEYIRADIYREIELRGSQQKTTAIQSAQDQRLGVTRPQQRTTDPYDLLEQHTYLDLDEDGYSEPYIVTILSDTREVLRIVPRFRFDDVTMNKKQVVKIKARHHFTKYPFIPSPDGSFYDLGFGGLLGPLNESVNTLINQLIDAGTLANRQGGFLGRGARLKGGRLRFKIGEWQPVNATGDDLRKSIVPLPIREPSGVLFQLLGFLVEYGERLSSVSDMMVGKTPGQNTPATTAMATLEEGMRVFTSIYKRIYRSCKQEFKIRYLLNQEYLNAEQYYTVIDTGNRATIFQQDYLGDPTDISPSADPNIISDAQRLTRAEALANRAAVVGGYDVAKVERRILEAMQIEAIDEIFPIDENGQPKIQPPDNPKVEIESAKFELESKLKSSELIIKLNIAMAQIDKMMAESILLIAKAEAEEQGSQMDAYRAQLETLREQRATLQEMMQLQEQSNAAPTGQNGLPAMEGQPSNAVNP